MVSLDDSINWDISCPGFVLGHVGDLFLISVGCLIGDDWNISHQSFADFLVFSLVNSVISGLIHSLVLSLVLNSVLGIEDGVVPDLLIFSVKNIVLVLVSDFFLISVESFRVQSLEIFNVGIVPVLFFISVENIVVSLVGDEWNISVLGLGIVPVHYSWFPSESLVIVRSELDFIGKCFSDLILWPVLGLSLFVLSGDWHLSGPDLNIDLCLDSIVNFFVLD